MARAYIDTTIPSYLAAYPSRDLVTAAHQQITHEWWRNAEERFDLYISEIVVREVNRGDPEAADRRRKVIADLPVLPMNDDVRRLTRNYKGDLGLPEDAEADILHIAFCVVYEIDYLVTWNCDHLANGEVMKRLQELNQGMGVFIPLMVTPEELMEKKRSEEADR